MLIALIGVWRSATAYPSQGGHEAWGILAKLFVASIGARVVWALANGWALRVLPHLTGGLDVGFGDW